MESIKWGGKYNPYRRFFNNDNKTCLPASMTTLGYERRKNTLKCLYPYKLLPSRNFPCRINQCVYDYILLELVP